MRGILLSTEKLSSILLISVLVTLVCATQIFAIPQDPWADAIVDSYNLGTGEPNNTLGLPYPARVPTDWYNYGVRINPGGYLVLDMGEGEKIPDILGNDLYVEEIDKEDNVGFSDDPYEVYVSNDAQTWYYLGQGSGDSEFDINGALPDARYVKIVGITTHSEIDAIEGLEDPWADAVVDSHNLGGGEPNNTLGPPHPARIPADWYNYGVRINPGGYLILDMGEGEKIPDILGNDLYVEEIDKEDNVGFSDDPYEVYVSNDAQTWYYLGQGSGDSEFDINGALPDARYVKIVGITTHSEINAIGILKGGPGWWRGNTHTHSNESDGDHPPADVAAHYKNLGYDFLVLTDHYKVTEFQKYSDPNFLCINGEEMTGSNHTNGIGLTSTIPSGTLQQNVDAVLAQGGIPHINHLSYSGLDIDDLYPVENLKFMEIHNALTDDWDEDTWDGLLSLGKLMYGIGSDDCHKLYSQSGRAWIMVRAPALTLEDILSAMNAGDFYASTGVILNDCIVDSNSMVIDSVNGDLIEFIGQDGQILKSVGSSYAEYSFLGTESYVRARISNSQGKYAWCQPVYIAPLTLNLLADWQMISLPIDPRDKRLETLFPEAVVVYGYEKDKGYVRIGNDEDLEVGRGYWILLDQDTSYTLTGSTVPSYAQSVSTDGWAMIGGCTHPARVIPHGCDIGVIYGYAQGAGYQRVTGHLERGKGYWILLNNVAAGATISVEKID